MGLLFGGMVLVGLGLPFIHAANIAQVLEKRQGGVDLENLSALDSYLTASPEVFTSDGKTLYEIPTIGLAGNSETAMSIATQISSELMSLASATSVAASIVSSVLKDVQSSIPAQDLTLSVPVKDVASATSVVGSVISSLLNEASTITPLKGLTTVPTKDLASATSVVGSVIASILSEAQSGTPLTNLATSTPAKELASSAPTEDTTTNVPAKELTTSVPVKEVTTSVPAEDITTSMPAKDLTTSVPAEDLTTNTLAKDISSSVPAKDLTFTTQEENLPSFVIPTVVVSPLPATDTSGPMTTVSVQAGLFTFLSTIPLKDLSTTTPTEESISTPLSPSGSSVQATTISEASSAFSTQSTTSLMASASVLVSLTSSGPASTGPPSASGSSPVQSELPFTYSTVLISSGSVTESSSPIVVQVLLPTTGETAVTVKSELSGSMTIESESSASASIIVVSLTLPTSSLLSVATAPVNASGVAVSRVIPIYTPEMLGNAYGGGLLPTPTESATVPISATIRVPPGYGTSIPISTPNISQPGKVPTNQSSTVIQTPSSATSGNTSLSSIGSPLGIQTPSVSISSNISITHPLPVSTSLQKFEGIGTKTTGAVVSTLLGFLLAILLL